MDARHLYVAMTRGSARLVICSATPELFPDSRGMSKGHLNQVFKLPEDLRKIHLKGRFSMHYGVPLSFAITLHVIIYSYMNTINQRCSGK